MTEGHAAPSVTAKSTKEFEFLRLSLHDIPACVDIVRRTFAELDSDPDAIANWFDARIAHNPWQSELDGIGLGAWDDGRLIAFRAMSAQPWWIGGRSAVIAFMGNTCVEPTYRGCGLGSKMIARSRECAELTGTTTAGNITQKVYRKQGFIAIGGEGNDFFRLRASFVGSLRSRLGDMVGRAAGSVADALLPRPEWGLGPVRGFRLEATTRCSDEFDELWERSKPGYPSCLERSSRYLNWRLFEFPTYPLSLLALRDERDRLRGYGVWHELQYSKDVACAVLRDLFVAPGDDEAARAFLALAIRRWRSLGITWVNLEVASERLTRLFRSLGYDQLPSVGNRYHVYSHHALAQEVVDGWFRSGLDGDYLDIRPPRQQP